MSQIKVDSIVPRAGLPAGANGGIIQVVSTTKTNTFTTSATSPTNVTGMAVTITPQSASHKILIICQISGAANSRYIGLRMARSTTPLAIGDEEGNRTRAAFTPGSNPSASSDAAILRVMGMHWLDSPNTTSATTYNLQAWIPYSTATFYLNAPAFDANDTYIIKGISSLTAMEVSV